MDQTSSTSDGDQLNGLSNSLVALYLTEETGLPCNAKGYEIAPFEAQDSAGTLVERRGLRVTFENGTTIKQPRHLLTFGSDDQRCNVILKAAEASPVHCKIYAQLNSGPNVWVIEDTSTNGTEYVDEESLLTRISKKVARGRVAAQGLYRIQIGRNIFSFCSPSNDQENFQRERYFRDLEPVLVTQEILRSQLRGVSEDYRPVGMIGEGGMGKVFKFIEMTTGLMIAVKGEKVETKEADERVQKEIRYMQSLRHPNLVEYIDSSTVTNAGIKKWFTAMPLYQGSLRDILPLELSAIETVMLQLFEGVAYLHAQRILHKDIKPENVLVKGKSRPDVVLADYGLCASLNNQAELMAPSGTPGFAAPEVSRMIVQTEAVDVFALGATFFFILEPQRCNGRDATIATMGNVMRRPPRVYAGLVQSMMAYQARERPSLKECFDIVKARQRDWRKRTPLVRLIPPVTSTTVPRRSLRLQKAVVQEPSILDLDYLKGHKRRLVPITASKQPQKGPELQQAPRRDFKVWDHLGIPRGRRILVPPLAPIPKPPTHTPVQQINFAAPPPPIADSPFANLGRDPVISPPTRRQAPPATHEPARTPIRKPDNEIKRKIRRGPERRQMVDRWHCIAVQKDKICHAAGELASGTPLNLFRGLGITAQSFGLIFRDYKAARLALHHIAPHLKHWGLDTNEKLMYGLKTHNRIFWPMTPEEYEAERLQSALNAPSTNEGRSVRVGEEAG